MDSNTFSINSKLLLMIFIFELMIYFISNETFCRKKHFGKICVSENLSYDLHV